MATAAVRKLALSAKPALDDLQLWRRQNIWKPRAGPTNTNGRSSSWNKYLSSSVIDAVSVKLFEAFGRPTGSAGDLRGHRPHSIQPPVSSEIDWSAYDRKQIFIHPADGTSREVSWQELATQSEDGETSYVHRIATQQAPKSSAGDSNISSYLNATTYDDLTQTALASLNPTQRATYDERAKNGTVPTNIRVELALTRHMQSEENANTGLFLTKLNHLERGYKMLRKDGGLTKDTEEEMTAAARQLGKDYPTPIDSPLTEWGQLGAKDLREQFKHCPEPDVIWSSCMQRARMTCNGAYGASSAPVITSDLIREKFGPNMQETKPSSFTLSKQSAYGYAIQASATTAETKETAADIVGETWLRMYDQSSRLVPQDDGSLLYTDPFSNADGSRSAKESTAEYDDRIRKCLDSITAMAQVYAGAKATDTDLESGEPVHIKIAAGARGRPSRTSLAGKTRPWPMVRRTRSS